MSDRITRLVLGLVAASLALVFALVLTSLLLIASGHSPVDALRQMIDYGKQPDPSVSIINNATTYYLAAIAVAIGFRMNLFNIGVDGQYRLAAMLAATVGGSVALPAGLRQIVIILVAVVVGATWAGIAGVLKVTRGVSEVISTIMLNFIATGVVAFLLRPQLFAVQVGNNIGTKVIPPSGRVAGFPVNGGSSREVYGLIVLAVAVGIGYQVLLNRTRFGFDLRATGRSASAALASGVNVRRMVLISMLLSGGVAGLVGMPLLLGDAYQYSLDFPAGLGFTGIAIALLGRNNPVGIAVGALLFAFLDTSSLPLDLVGVPKEIVDIAKGIVVLSVVVAYELVRRVALVRQQRMVGRQLDADATAPTPEGAPA
jgi:simple sugar transport system permease protein